MRRTILVDIDHTLSAAWHRDELIGAEGGWNAYHSAAPQDEPIHDVMSLINGLVFSDETWTIIALTARPEKWRNITMAWLVKHGIHIDELLMRPDESWHPAPEIKVQLAQQRFPGDSLTNEVAFLLEDRADVCEAFHTLGITTLQVKGRQND
jgi:hypothetical protein